MIKSQQSFSAIRSILYVRQQARDNTRVKAVASAGGFN
jgi:hypothetical protein